VPCLIAWPGLARPATSDALVSIMDFFSTLLAIPGV
jgi:arylsulfatase A-like enzyme